MFEAIAKYRKAITVGAALVIGVLLEVFGADSEWYKLAVGIAGLLGVYAVPNKTP
jgi:hypothetical protein